MKYKLVKMFMCVRYACYRETRYSVPHPWQTATISVWIRRCWAAKRRRFLQTEHTFFCNVPVSIFVFATNNLRVDQDQPCGLLFKCIIVVVFSDAIVLLSILIKYSVSVKHCIEINILKLMFPFFTWKFYFNCTLIDICDTRVQKIFTNNKRLKIITN